MTICIGLLCQDGVVIGTDSSATFSAGQFRTVEQECKKIDIIHNQVVLTGSGQIGLGQRFGYIVEKYWNPNKTPQLNPIDIAKNLSNLGIADFQSTYLKTGQYSALLAFPSQNKFNLCEFTLNDFQPELKTENIWYVSMGCGQPIGVNP